MRLYYYVSPKETARQIQAEPSGIPIRSADDIAAWTRSTSQVIDIGCVTVTFVVDASGQLLIVDRRSEHVACAGGKPVRSAGEMTFRFGQNLEVAEVSNQLTGYCPEPESWRAVADALIRAGFSPPDDFTLACVFRRCEKCGEITLVKNRVLECGMCGRELPAEYNVQE